MAAITPYAAIALQTRCDAINFVGDNQAVRQQMMASIERIAIQVKGSSMFLGPHTRLITLPEYFLTGHPYGDSIAGWRDKAALEIAGAEYEALGKVAQDNNVFLSGNAYESDPHFPELYFQTSFIIDPSGDVILRYRRLISMFAPTPHDVLDKYLDIYGADALFPVVDTELGRLAVVASEEILYPEICRALALRGAEVICHSSSEVGSPQLTPKKVAKLARAYENHCYIVSANSAGIANAPVPEASTDGGSLVVDFHGHLLAEADCGESMVANAEINIDSLRHYRRRAGMFNTLSRQRLELFRDTYSQQVYPANTLLDQQGETKVPERKHFIATQQSVIDRLIERGVI